jgi:hypothetical protein
MEDLLDREDARLKRLVRRRGISCRLAMGIRNVTPGRRTESLASGTSGSFIVRPLPDAIFAALKKTCCCWLFE